MSLRLGQEIIPSSLHCRAVLSSRFSNACWGFRLLQCALDAPVTIQMAPEKLSPIRRLLAKLLLNPGVPALYTRVVPSKYTVPACLFIISNAAT